MRSLDSQGKLLLCADPFARDLQAIAGFFIGHTIKLAGFKDLRGISLPILFYAILYYLLLPLPTKFRLPWT